MPHLNEIQRAQIIVLLEEGFSQRHVARRMNINQSSISRVWVRYQQTDFVGEEDKVEDELHQFEKIVSS